MNVKLFKKLIKEAVADAIHEELPELIEEALERQNKKILREGKTASFTSADVLTTRTSNPLSNDIRSQLASKMGSEFGFQQPINELKVIDEIDETTGEKVNPFLAFIADSANNMTPQDRAGLKNLG